MFVFELDDRCKSLETWRLKEHVLSCYISVNRSILLSVQTRWQRRTEYNLVFLEMVRIYVVVLNAERFQNGTFNNQEETGSFIVITTTIITGVKLICKLYVNDYMSTP